MVINLLHEQPLNAYLTDLVYQGENVPKQQTYNGEFESPDYVEQHRDEIVKGILYQYIKSRVRKHMALMEKEPAFVLVDKTRDDLPEWTANTFARGENIYEFDGSKMSPKLRDEITMIRDFLYDEAGQYVDKVFRIARKTKKKPKIRYDYLKTSNEYDTFEKALASAKHWHENMAVELSKRNKARDLLEKSLKGVQHVMDLQDGLSVYKLTTEEALDFESEYMGHCVGKGAYDQGVKDGKIQIYSIRDENGEPHATFEVQNDTVYQCKGKANKRPIKKYIPAIQEFVKRKNLEIDGDAGNMGFLKINEKYYNIYDLPKEMVVEGDLNLECADLEELPDLSKWVIKGTFSCLADKLTSLRGAPQNVGGNFDCASNQLTSLDGAPQNVGGNFDCASNQLTSLDGAPQKVGGSFMCNFNQLTSLEGGPKSVGGDFYCSGNKLTNLVGVPEIVGGNFSCVNNQLTSLIGAPQTVGGAFDCSNNKLTSLRGAPQNVEGNFDCSYNQLTSLQGAPKRIGRSFLCSHNKLTDLKGAPEIVDEIFVCSFNPLFSFEGLPKTVGCYVEFGQKDGSLPFMAPEYIMDIDFVEHSRGLSLIPKGKQIMVDNWIGAHNGDKIIKFKQGIIKLKKKAAKWFPLSTFHDY